MPLDLPCPKDKSFHTEADSSNNEYPTQVSGFLSKPLDPMQRDAWCLHGRGISQKPGKKIRDIKLLVFNLFWAGQRQVLNSYLSLNVLYSLLNIQRLEAQRDV